MREFQVDLTKVISAGLRSDHRTTLNRGQMVKCLNLRTIQDGLFSPEAIEGIVGVSTNWPYPQIFNGSSKVLLAGPDYIKQIDPTDLSLTTLSTYDAYNPNNLVSITPGGVWHFVDNIDSWTMVNGISMLFNRAGFVLGETERILVQSDVF